MPPGFSSSLLFRDSFFSVELLFNQHHSLSLRSIKKCCAWRGQNKPCTLSVRQKNRTFISLPVLLGQFLEQTCWHRELALVCRPSSSLLVLTDRVYFSTENLAKGIVTSKEDNRIRFILLYFSMNSPPRISNNGCRPSTSDLSWMSESCQKCERECR